MDEQKLLEGIETKLDEHGLLLDEEGGVFTAMLHAMKTNPNFQGELAQAAVDGMVRRLRAEAKKYKGSLGGWRGDVRSGFSGKANIDTFSKMARGEIERAVLNVVRKFVG